MADDGDYLFWYFAKISIKYYHQIVFCTPLIFEVWFVWCATRFEWVTWRHLYIISQLQKNRLQLHLINKNPFHLSVRIISWFEITESLCSRRCLTSKTQIKLVYMVNVEKSSKSRAINRISGKWIISFYYVTLTNTFTEPMNCWIKPFNKWSKCNQHGSNISNWKLFKARESLTFRLKLCCNTFLFLAIFPTYEPYD